MSIGGRFPKCKGCEEEPVRPTYGNGYIYCKIKRKEVSMNVCQGLRRFIFKGETRKRGKTEESL